MGLPHLRIPVITLIEPLFIRSIKRLRLKSLFIIINLDMKFVAKSTFFKVIIKYFFAVNRLLEISIKNNDNEKEKFCKNRKNFQ